MSSLEARWDQAFKLAVENGALDETVVDRCTDVLAASESADHNALMSLHLERLQGLFSDYHPKGPPFGAMHSCGEWVLIHGLAAKPELNGTTGSVIKYITTRGRYEVMLHSGYGGANILVKHANLRWIHCASSEPYSLEELNASMARRAKVQWYGLEKLSPEEKQLQAQMQQKMDLQAAANGGTRDDDRKRRVHMSDLPCAECGLLWAKDDFSKAQLSKKTARRCKECVAKAPGLPPSTDSPTAVPSTARARKGWDFMDASGTWQPYKKRVSKEIEEMYAHGAPHCLYHPTQLSLCDTGEHQPDAMQGLMVGFEPPANVCTHRILFDRMVDVAVYEGTFVKVRRNGPPSKEREEEREWHMRDGFQRELYERTAGLQNAAAFGL